MVEKGFFTVRGWKVDVLKRLTHSEMRGGSESQVVVVLVAALWPSVAVQPPTTTDQSHSRRQLPDAAWEQVVLAKWSPVTGWNYPQALHQLNICLPRASHGTSAGGETELGAPALPCLPPHSLLAGRWQLCQTRLLSHFQQGSVLSWRWYDENRVTSGQEGTL